MDLKAAAAAVKSTLGKESVYALVRLAPGLVESTAGHRGTIAPCPDVKATCFVDGSKFLSVAMKGKAAVSGIEKTKLVLQADGSKFTLPTVSSGFVPAITRTGSDGWFALSNDQIKALSAVAGLAGKDDPGGLAGKVLLGERWGVASTGNLLAIVWTPCGIAGNLGTVLASDWIERLDGASRLWVGHPLSWCEDSDGVLRWSRAMLYDYPEAAVGDLVTKVRGTRCARAKVKAKDLLGEVERAGLVVASPIWPVRLTLDEERVRLAVQGDNTFDGRVEPVAHEGTGSTVLSWAPLAAAVKALAGLDDEITLSFGGTNEPFELFSTGPVPVEVILNQTVA